MRFVVLYFSIWIVILSTGCSRDYIRSRRSPLTATIHNDLGVIKEKDGNLELALSHYKIAIEKKSEWWLPYYNAAGVLFRMEQSTEALRYIVRAEELTDYNNADVLNNHAWILHTQGIDERALKFAQKAVLLKNDPARQDTLRAIQSALSNNSEDKRKTDATEER